jgi:hypothetical protein
MLAFLSSIYLLFSGIGECISNYDIAFTSFAKACEAIFRGTLDFTTTLTRWGVKVNLRDFLTFLCQMGIYGCNVDIHIDHKPVNEKSFFHFHLAGLPHKYQSGVDVIGRDLKAECNYECYCSEAP